MWFIVRLMAYLILLYGVTFLPWFRTTAFPSWLQFNASIASRVLQWMGEPVQRTEFMVHSDRFALEIRRGCDAIEPIGLFIAAVLAFPAHWRQRAIALAIGLPALLALNIVRIVSLFEIGVHAPATFASAHVELWQSLFIIATMFLWAMWAWRVAATKRKPVDAHA